jgi:hypothetical protein
VYCFDLFGQARQVVSAIARESRASGRIAQQLKGELPSIEAICAERSSEAIARRLTISVRQLQRELQAEGTSFQGKRHEITDCHVFELDVNRLYCLIT